MNASSYRTVNMGRLPRFLVVAGALILAAPLFFPMKSAPGATEADNLPKRAQSLEELWASGEGKALDKGVVDVFSVDPILPEAWIYIDDSTVDGSGTEYWLMHSSFVPPSPLNDNRTLEFDYVNGFSPLTLQECIDWIVATYSHVSDAGDLTIQKKTVTPVP